MSGTELAQYAVMVVFGVNSLLLGSLIGLKLVHRRRMAGHEGRRQAYVALLSRHVAFEDCTDPITPEMAEDPAFLDALIDVRNSVAGPELSTLRGIVDRHGVIERQIRRLRSPFPLGRRLRAAVALAEIGDETAAPTLMDHLDDREQEIRIQSARGLGRIRWTPAIDRIVWKFSNETPWVRIRFSDTLTVFGDKATWPLLAYVRINHRHETEGPKLALRTLAQIQDREAVKPIIEILDQATDMEIEIAAIEALGALESPEALGPLETRLRSPRWELRAKAATAMGDIRDGRAIPLLIEAMRDPDWWVRRNSAAALTRIPGGVQVLYTILEGADRFAADAAAEALTDAGELISARHRLESTDDWHAEPLLAYMGAPERESS